MEKLAELILEKSKGYGTPDSHLTMDIFRAIINDVKKELEKQRIMSYRAEDRGDK